MKFVIRLRDGSFFRNLKTVSGTIGPAKRFNSRAGAHQFIARHPTIVPFDRVSIIRADGRSKA